MQEDGGDAVGVELLQYLLLSRATRAATLGAIGGRFPGGFLLGGVELAIAIPVKALEQFLPRDRVLDLCVRVEGSHDYTVKAFRRFAGCLPIGFHSPHFHGPVCL